MSSYNRSETVKNILSINEKLDDLNSLQAKDCYKNLNKRSNCLKCNIALTQDNYKKSRTVCRIFFISITFLRIKKIDFVLTLLLNQMLFLKLLG